MTRDEILDLPAGGELDALIAGRIMGWTDIRKETFWWNKHDHSPEYHGTYVTVAPSTMRGKVENWSTDIGKAWRVVEKLAASGARLVLEDWREHAKPSGLHGWAAYFNLPDGHDAGQVVAATAPHAICLAALLVPQREEPQCSPAS